MNAPEIKTGTLTNALGEAVPDMMYIEHDGFEIHDPYLSDCGRFDVHPSHYGLTLDQAVTMQTNNAGKMDI